MMFFAFFLVLFYVQEISDKGRKKNAHFVLNVFTEGINKICKFFFWIALAIEIKKKTFIIFVLHKLGTRVS